MKEIILDSSLTVQEGTFPELNPKYFFGFGDENLEAVTAIDTPITHRNYLSYLSMCWKYHYGVVISPSILWNIVLSNLAFEVIKNPDTYQKYFTKFTEKQEIVIQQGGRLISPELLIDAVRDYMPIDIMDHTFPEFSTDTLYSRIADYTAFLDMVSPYYEYSMFMCGIPKIKILGTKEDWLFFQEHCNNLITCIPEFNDYLNKVNDKIYTIINEMANYSDFFRLDRCGSGSQVEVGGWIRDFFIEQPIVAYPENFVSCISKIDYKCYSNNKNYRLYAGLFSSEIEDDYLMPLFNAMYFEKKENNEKV